MNVLLLCDIWCDMFHVVVRLHVRPARGLYSSARREGRGNCERADCSRMLGQVEVGG